MKSRLSYLSHAMQVPLAGHSQEAAHIVRNQPKSLKKSSWLLWALVGSDLALDGSYLALDGSYLALDGTNTALPASIVTRHLM